MEKSKNSASEKSLDKAQKDFEAFNDSLTAMTMDRANEAPKLEVEQQTRLSQNQIANSKDIYLKPERTMGSKEPFNEKYREAYEFAKQMVCFIAENREIIGETIECWTKKFAGIPAELWKVPTNKPVWGPRYLAEQIKGCKYHRFSMENKPIEHGSIGTVYGNMVVDNTVQRLDAIPASTRKSIFMGSESF